VAKGVAEHGKETNTHNFFSWIWLTSPPPPSYYIRYVFLSSDVFLNVFLSYGPGFSKILYLQPQPTYSSTHKLSNHRRRCSACKSLHGGTYVRNYRKRWVLQVFRLPATGLVHIKSRRIITEYLGNRFTSHGCRRWRRFLHSHWNDEMYPPSAPSLTRSNAFGPLFLNLERSEPSEMDPWYFHHMSPPPC
jgi:hypothetical protein